MVRAGVCDIRVMRIRTLVGRTPRSAADPPVGWLWFENSAGTCHYSGMTFYRRRLPHFFHEIDQPVFLTWRLHDSLPPNRTFPTDTLNSGRAFAAMDRLLDEACSGAVYLRQPAIADMIVEGQRHAGFDGKPLWAGRELRPPGAAYGGIREDPELH